MAQLSDEELSEIIDRDMPGHQIVRRKASDAGDRPDAAAKPDPKVDEASPDLDALREKYLGESGESAPAGGADAPVANTDDEIVIVEPKTRTDPLDHGARPKAVVVSGKERRVIGYQG